METNVWDEESGLAAGKILPQDDILEFLYKNISFPIILYIIARIAFLFSSSFGLTTSLKRITVGYEPSYLQILSIWATLYAILIALQFAAEGRFIGTKWNRSGDMTVKNIECLLPSLLLSLLVGLIFEGMYMLLLYKQQPFYNEIIQDMDSDDGEEEQFLVKIPRKRFQGKHLLCSWPFFWYLLLFGTDSFLKSISKSALENQYEYVGPMRLTKMPSLYYSNVTYDSGGDMLKLFPCMHDTRIRKYVYDQPSVQVTLEIGWGYF
ncbi:hypothetical protein CTEN210_02708 [Chaetoceros tenuissimus]|uniref:Uncharacterized protein n=1 Tax=Chaetoceros tenuissimus TaxID=426638 RepID=A0AAD3H1B7_9STRA|nr:hypothetical protein CTEN210_02708 [Chaetoceros tenuissimus]